VVDGHPVVREGLSAILSHDPEFKVVGQTGSSEEAVVLAERLRPDVVLLDLRLPGRSAIEVCKELRRRLPKTRSVILASSPYAAAIRPAFSAGALGFLLKESEPSVLREGIRSVARGVSFTDPNFVDRFAAPASGKRRAKGPFGLTLQEMRVVELLPRGLTNREIGEELGISEHTVKTHLSNANRKLNARDRAEAAAIALREGLA
jgi:DNA-binding NarL/FixJ family response regulator